MNQVLVMHERTARERWSMITMVAPVADRREDLLAGLVQRTEEGASERRGIRRRGGGRRRFEQRIEHVTADEPLVEASIDLWPRHHIEPGHLTVDDHEETDLVALTGKGLKAFGQCVSNP